MDNKENYLKLMTYNIHSGKNIKRENTFPKMIEFIKDYCPDILAVQEINENKKRGYQITEIKNSLDLNVHFGPHVKFGEGQYGIATFSHFQIIEKQHILLPSLGEQRGLLHTTFKIHNKKIHVLNTHLGLNTQERKRQFAVIQKHLEGIKGSFILMGDFNTSDLILDSSLFHDTSFWGDQENLPTLIETHKRIDYILLSNNSSISYYKIFPVYFSDHFPVTAQIMI